MPRLVDLDDLVGAAEIAERLGLLHTASVHAWRRRHDDFPEPVKRVSGVWLWRWSAVEAWARRTGRLP